MTECGLLLTIHWECVKMLGMHEDSIAHNAKPVPSAAASINYTSPPS